MAGEKGRKESLVSQTGPAKERQKKSKFVRTREGKVGGLSRGNTYKKGVRSEQKKFCRCRGDVFLSGGPCGVAVRSTSMY